MVVAEGTSVALTPTIAGLEDVGSNPTRCLTGKILEIGRESRSRIPCGAAGVIVRAIVIGETMYQVSAFVFIFLAIGSAGTIQAQTSAVRTAAVEPPSTPESDRSHVLVGANELVSREFLAALNRQSNLTVVADFWYNGAARRVLARSLSLGEVDDPADLRLFRAPGAYPNAIYGRVEPCTTTGHIGFAGFTTREGVRAYYGAMQGYVLTEDTGVLAFSTAMGRAGVGRNGQYYGAQDLVPHVAVFPDGATVFGWDTPPRLRPKYTLQVLGDLRVEGVVYASQCVEVP